MHKEFAHQTSHRLIKSDSSVFIFEDLKTKRMTKRPQECADCDHIHPDSRESQAAFRCAQCGHTDNADANAATVINLILDPGTGLSDRGVLIANRHRALSLRKTEKAKTFLAISDDASKKTNNVALAAA